MTKRHPIAGFSRSAASPVAILILFAVLHGCGGSGSPSLGGNGPGPEGGQTTASSSGGGADGADQDVASSSSGSSGAVSSTSGSGASSGVIVYICPGCIDLNDQCQPGTANDNCGLGSDSGSPTCTNCTAFGQVCNPAGDCVDGPSGGGSSSSGGADAGGG
jgi:hypothetical protein